MVRSGIRTMPSMAHQPLVTPRDLDILAALDRCPLTVAAAPEAQPDLRTVRSPTSGASGSACRSSAPAAGCVGGRTPPPAAAPQLLHAQPPRLPPPPRAEDACRRPGVTSAPSASPASTTRAAWPTSSSTPPSPPTGPASPSPASTARTRSACAVGDGGASTPTAPSSSHAPGGRPFSFFVELDNAHRAGPLRRRTSTAGSGRSASTTAFQDSLPPALPRARRHDPQRRAAQAHPGRRGRRHAQSAALPLLRHQPGAVPEQSSCPDQPVLPRSPREARRPGAVATAEGCSNIRPPRRQRPPAMCRPCATLRPPQSLLPGVSRTNACGFPLRPSQDLGVPDRGWR